MKWSLIVFLFLASHFTYAETVSLEGAWQIQSTVYDGGMQSIRMPKHRCSPGSIFLNRYRHSEFFPLGMEVHTQQWNVSETIINHSNTALIGQTFSVTVELSEGGNTLEQVVDPANRCWRSRWVRLE